MKDPRVVLRQMAIADQRFLAAIDESALAPPDAGFADRLRAIATACEAEAVVLYDAAATPQLRWPPITEPVTEGLSYELRPGGNRPGPAELWTQFDHAVNAVSDAQAGEDFTAIADAFRHLARTAVRVAGAVDEERHGESQGALRDAG